MRPSASVSPPPSARPAQTGTSLYSLDSSLLDGNSLTTARSDCTRQLSPREAVLTTFQSLSGKVRNMFRDQMKAGDLAFFYHSSCPEPGIYGAMKIVSNAYPDPTQFDPKSDYYDGKSTPEDPRWLLVDVQFLQKFEQPVLLSTLRENEAKLEGLRVLEKGTRLSVTPVKAEHWKLITRLAGVKL
ncbi:EVE domain-containing protein [Hydrocarboniphaga sp.]|uniref:EVE domain-containing protein n=1 Tax=Hydrocarboniphaga sp. TaxID=2033016 RepID=UPI002AB88D9B|nr:EVE domain-containing protein [Hydrocarboniphaga sp.]MDZ4078565.1 EVE domain-containing protein [Hydrocarboniphaga sp.]